MSVKSMCSYVHLPVFQAHESAPLPSDLMSGQLMIGWNAVYMVA